MDYRIITSTKEFTELEKDWKTIEDKSINITFFSTYDYCYAWWEAYQNNPDYQLWIICLYQNNKVTAIAPLMLVRISQIFQTSISLRFLARADYHEFLINNEIISNKDRTIKKIFSIIEGSSELWDEINLTHIHYKNVLTQFIFKSKYNHQFKYLIENPYINTAKYLDYNDFTKRCTPAKAKQYAKRLKRKTNYTLKVSNENMIKTFSEIHIAEKKYLEKQGYKNRHSLFENIEMANFIENISVKKQILSYYLIDEMDKTIIYNAGYLLNNTFYSVLTAFDPKFSNLGVGRVMYLEIFRENYLNPKWKILDAGTGRYPWKFEWTSDFNLLYQLHYIKPGKNITQRILRKMSALKKAIIE
jgi:hypothetical protein